MATLSRIPALPDEGPRAKGNPLSTRFYLRGPMHQQMWSWVQRGECAWDRPFEVYPQPPHRPCGDINSFQRTMFRHLTINNTTTTTAPSTPATVSSLNSTSRAEAVVFDADSSDSQTASIPQHQ